MKRLAVAFVALLVLVSCNKQAEITIMNLSEIDRQDELVEVCLCQLKKMDPSKVVVLDSTGKQLPIQLIYKGEPEPQSIVFPVSVKAGRKVVLTVKEGSPEKLVGINPIGDDFETNCMERLSGAGILAPYSEDSIWTLGDYDRFKLLDKGALRSSFVLYYDSVYYGSHVLTAEVQVTLDKGSYLDELSVRFSGDTAQLRLATGTTIQTLSYTQQGNPERGFVALAFNKPSSGREYVGFVFLNRLAEMKVVDNQLACISLYMQGETFRYFSGTVREQVGIASDQAWFAYLSNQYMIKSNPLDIRIDR